MKKFVLCLTAVLFAAGTAHAEYVRKRIRPNFFIPARELERAEKLPPFPEPAEEPDNGEEIHYVIPSPAAGKASAVVVDHETPPEKVHVNFLQTKLMEEEQPAAAPVDSDKILPDENGGQVDTSLEKTQSYQNIRKAYAEDLKVIAKTGKAPANPDVKAALQKMNSDDGVWVDDSFGTTAEASEETGG